MTRAAREPLTNQTEDLIFIGACFCAGLAGAFVGWSIAYLIFGRCS